MAEAEAAAVTQAQAARARLATRQNKVGKGKGEISAKDAPPPPITEAASNGQPEAHLVTPAMRLFLRAPVVAASNALYGRFLALWPDVVIWGALSDRNGSGIHFDRLVAGVHSAAKERIDAVPEPIGVATRALADTAAAAALSLAAEEQSDGDRIQAEVAAAATEALKLLSAEDMAIAASLAEMLTYTKREAERELREFGGALRSYNAEDEAQRLEAYQVVTAELAATDPTAVPPPFEPHVLDGICDTLWELAAGYNGKLTREALPGILLAKLRPADYADLLRRCLDALDGTDAEYEESPSRRFGAP